MPPAEVPALTRSSRPQPPAEAPQGPHSSWIHSDGRGHLPIMRSAGFRFAAVYVVLFTASAGALALFLWWSTAGLLDRQVPAAIELDARGLRERWDDGGVIGLIKAIGERVDQNVDDDAIYLLVDQAMRPLAGNLANWPAGVDSPDYTYETRLSRAGMPTLVQVQEFDLPNGYRLLVGRDVQVRVQLRHLLTGALLWAIVIVVVMASIGALLVRSLFRRMLANVSATAGAIAAGDFTQRVTPTGRGDELDQLAEVINDMLDRIERLMDGVRQVSNAIAHDLRTPITRARTRLEDALLHAHGEAELRAAIERVTTELDGIVAVFQALLRIAEIEAGSRRAAFTRLDAAPLLAEVAELYDAVAEEKGVVLVTEISGPLPVYGDAALIRQAVANLVDNAVKFSPSGGTVRLVGRPTAGGSEIIVSDQGPGIPEADRARATERFYRGEAARNTPGSGLGLSLVQAVAQLHFGSLRLEDAGPGLIAILGLPAPEEADG
jgi:signal transduction histidine kinase